MIDSDTEHLNSLRYHKQQTLDQIQQSTDATQRTGLTNTLRLYEILEEIAMRTKTMYEDALSEFRIRNENIYSQLLTDIQTTHEPPTVHDHMDMGRWGM